MSAASIPARSAAGPPAGARARQCGELVLPAAGDHYFRVPMRRSAASCAASRRLMILLWARMRAASAARDAAVARIAASGVASRSLMALAAAVVGPQLLCFCSGQVGHGCPNVSRGSDASARTAFSRPRAFAPRMRSDLTTSCSACAGDAFAFASEVFQRPRLQRARKAAKGGV